ncbi:heme ABC exporter ATP-binding protein CcmA [Parasphingopyxis algicola]|uniref:heme ABC exporter ATP-binding protein CcmA n=1 Tax=Parasphingopyxis algicola TaxID=2026624 RepID=UPI0015A32AAE|nr:heme ABC exporter ATP-binding protein CcmA [Parasphingopyxis algicola]QLC25239.1 heme ABC exporter ATP-binding protein CcmA [Parasphingopyxis algicola]
MSAALTLAGLGCVRGDRALFSGLDLALKAGGAALVTGPNGAGKTSLLRVIAGLLPKPAGTVEIAGTIAFAGEQAALDRELPLERALRYWAALDRRDAGAIRAALDSMALGDLADVPVRMLSTGQSKRAALARVIAGAADIWLLDEPANGLDSDARARLEAAIAGHRAAGGIVVAATHQPLAMPDATNVPIGGVA